MQGMNQASSRSISSPISGDAPPSRDLVLVFATSFLAVIAISGLIQQQSEALRLLRGLCTSGAPQSLSSMLHLWIRPSAAQIVLLAAGVLATQLLAVPPRSLLTRIATGVGDVMTLSLAMTVGCVAAQAFSASPEGHALSMIAGVLGGIAMRIRGSTRWRKSANDIGQHRGCS